LSSGSSYTRRTRTSAIADTAQSSRRFQDERPHRKGQTPGLYQTMIENVSEKRTKLAATWSST
jgi:hypothetical protein